jgi:hypothetical protein
MAMMEEGLPDTQAAASIVDRCPQMLLSCIVNGKLNIRRMLEFQQRSYDEFCQCCCRSSRHEFPFTKEGGADEQELDEKCQHIKQKTAKGETYHVYQPYHWR